MCFTNEFVILDKNDGMLELIASLAIPIGSRLSIREL